MIIKNRFLFLKDKFVILRIAMLVTVGSILIAEPFIGDQHFERTVVLIVSHDENGTVGFVLNQQSNLFVSDVMEGWEALGHFPIYIGGPVEQNTLHFIYRFPHSLENSVCVGENTYWGGDIDVIKELVSTGQLAIDDIKFFLGYSGWEPKQIDDELKEKVWILNSFNADYALVVPADNLWRTILKEKGGKYKLYANYPIDPRLN